MLIYGSDVITDLALKSTLFESVRIIRANYSYDNNNIVSKKNLITYVNIITSSPCFYNKL